MMVELSCVAFHSYWIKVSDGFIVSIIRADDHHRGNDGKAVGNID